MYNEITWKEGELLAQKYMKKNGYKILFTNYTCVGVELDIVSTLSVSVQKKNLKKELKNAINMSKDKKYIEILKKSYLGLMENLQEILVVTEVKSRSNENYGLGIEAISESKIQHIKRGAEFLLQKKEFKNMQVRFDVASVDSGKVNYFENAF